MGVLSQSFKSWLVHLSHRSSSQIIPQHITLQITLIIDESLCNLDSCAQHKCPPPPYERKCQTIPADVNKPHDCCPKYFCEENLVPEMCHFKLLESGCNVPPEGKTNCVGFHDQHGCCPKFQCDGGFFA